MSSRAQKISVSRFASKCPLVEGLRRDEKQKEPRHLSMPGALFWKIYFAFLENLTCPTLLKGSSHALDQRDNGDPVLSLAEASAFQKRQKAGYIPHSLFTAAFSSTLSNALFACSTCGGALPTRSGAVSPLCLHGTAASCRIRAGESVS